MDRFTKRLDPHNSATLHFQCRVVEFTHHFNRKAKAIAMQLTFNPPEINAVPSEPIAEKCIAEKQTATKQLVRKSRRSDRVRDHLTNERTYLAWMRSDRFDGVWDCDCADSDVSTANGAIDRHKLETGTRLCDRRAANRMALDPTLFWGAARY